MTGQRNSPITGASKLDHPRAASTSGSTTTAPTAGYRPGPVLIKPECIYDGHRRHYRGREPGEQVFEA
jgi:hypothetical protein